VIAPRRRGVVRRGPNQFPTCTPAASGAMSSLSLCPAKMKRGNKGGGQQNDHRKFKRIFVLSASSVNHEGRGIRGVKSMGQIKRRGRTIYQPDCLHAKLSRPLAARNRPGLERDDADEQGDRCGNRRPKNPNTPIPNALETVWFPSSIIDFPSGMVIETIPSNSTVGIHRSRPSANGRL